MSESAGTRFLDGLRVTARHLNHVEETTEQSSRDLRRVLGVGQIGYGFRLLLAADEHAVTLTPGLAFTPSGLRLALDEGVALTLPAAGDALAVILRAENHDDPGSRLGDEPTIVYADTVVEIVPAEGATAGPDALRIGTVTRDGATLGVEQDSGLYLTPARHGHSGEFYEDASGMWRFDGAVLSGEDPQGPVGPPGPVGPAGPPGPAGDLGPAGPQGEIGPAGTAGDPGPVGPAGPQGDPGAQGEAGPAGPAGETGPQGFSGPAGERGAQGDPGPVGPAGPEGPAGPPGATGPQGDTGLNGPAGLQGPIGPEGPAGPVGPAGPAGPAGPQGERGVTGVAGPKGDIGPAGPAGSQGDRGDPGPRGEAGPAGPAGQTGSQGDKGDPGPRGEAGPAGPAGQTGSQGERGLTGQQGPTGAAGPQGLTGSQGLKGDTGAQGLTGAAGPQGLPGPQGERGLTGAQGPPGATGPQGLIGPQGDRGVIGPQGLTGPAGAPGQTGPQGDRGLQGPQGLTGPAGAPGQTGLTGPQGPAGPPGQGLGNVAFLKELTWDSSKQHTPQEAIGVLRLLAFLFSAPLDNDRVRPWASRIVSARLEIPPRTQFNTPLSPVFPLRGKIGISDERLQWTLSEDFDMVLGLLNAGGLVTFDVACDYLTDVDGRPVSGNAWALLGREPIVPGGILRVYLQVRGG